MTKGETLLFNLKIYRDKDGKILVKEAPIERLSDVPDEEDN